MEEWKIVEFSPNYSVSTLGRVRRTNSKKILSLGETRDGYLKITLYPMKKTYSVHRLIGMVWLSDTYSPELEIDHLNSNRKDNSVTNLEWVTREENARRVKNRYKPKGELNPSAVINEQQAYYIKYESFSKSNSEIAKELNIDNEIVRLIRVRKMWTHVLNLKLEEDYTNKKVTYKKSLFSNHSPELKSQVVEAILLGEKTSEICKKLEVSRKTVARYKNKLKLEEKPSTTIENIEGLTFEEVSRVEPSGSKK